MPAKKVEPFLTRMEINNKPIPDITGSTIALRNAGLLASRSQFFSQLIDDQGSGKDLQTEDDKDIRRILGPNVSSAFKPTYNFEELIRFHEAWREDGIASMCVELLAQAIFGDHFRTIIDVNEEFEDDEEKKAALDRLKANTKIQSFKREIDIINKELKATNNFKALFIQAAVFGSDAAIVERDPTTNLPQALKILPAMSLGRRFVDKRTWNLIGLEYLDYKFPASILKSEDLFYIALRNYHMSPGTYQFGYSLFEKIVSLSETNRVINQRNLPETNFRLWSPMLLIKMPNNVNQSVMKQMQDDVANGAGNAIVTNQQVNIDPVVINVSLQEMTNERSQNNLEIIRQLQFPEILYNPDIMNRATSQEVMESWNVFVLGPYQTWIADVIQEQWLDPIIQKLIENDQAGIADEPGEGIVPPEEQGLPTSSNQQSNTSIFKDAMDPITGKIKVSRLPWKIKVVFEPINLDTFLDKVKAYMILFNNDNGPIGGERVLRGVGLEEDIPDYQQRQLEKQQWQQEQFKMAQKPPLDGTQKPNANTNTGDTQANTGFNTDVAGGMMDALKAETKVSARAASTIKHRLQQERQRQVDKEQKTLLEMIMPKLLKKLEEI